METRSNHKISWTTIYSLGLLPTIIIWGAPILGEYTITITSIVVGLIWSQLPYRLVRYAQGCGLVGWATGWSMTIGGLCKATLLTFGLHNIPIILFLAPALVILLLLFEKQKVQPNFCFQCIVQRGSIQERRLLGDFGRYESRHIACLILVGSILTTLLSWGLFVYGIEQDSRMGNYFYFYFPLGLTLAIILFEIIRRTLIQYLLNPQEKRKSNTLTQPTIHQNISYTSIRIVVFCQEQIYLIQVEDKDYCDSGLDTPIHSIQTHCYTLNAEKKLAQKVIRETLQIEYANLKHLSSTTSSTGRRRVGQYLLFLPKTEKSKLDIYKGKWYSVNELLSFCKQDKLHPLFKEFYARLYTVVNTARTYYENGKRRFSMQDYTPSFSLQEFEKMDIDLDNPIWLYISRHNEDKLWYRLRQWFDKICHSCKKASHD